MAFPVLSRLNKKVFPAVLRTFAFLLVLLGTAFFLSVLVALAAPGLSEALDDLYVSSVVTLASAIIAHVVMLRWFDKRPWSAVGLGREDAHPRLLVKGLIIGLAGIGIPCLLLIASYQLRLIPSGAGNSFSAAGLGVAIFLPAAFFEELMMRGYLFMVIREAFGWKSALILTSTIFGLLHLANPNVGVDSILLVILAGFFLGAILLATGSLFAAGMAHFGWNWMMAGVLHANVSGVEFPSPDFRVVDNGPDWLTGGAWGPEGGLAAAMGMLVSFIYLYARRIRRMES